MLSRFAIAILLASILPCTAYAQETSDVVVGHGGDRASIMACGPDGKAYLSRSSASDHSSGTFSLVLFARDGSITTFGLPETVSPTLVAEGTSGVNVLSVRIIGGKKTSEMYHFDGQGNLLAWHDIQFDLGPSRMAVTASGKTVVMGSWYQDPGVESSLKNGGVVFGADDRVIKHFELPLPPEGGGWVFDSQQMLGGDDAAYIMLHSYDPPATGLAKILEDGQVQVKIIPNAPYDDQRHHNQWMFGAGVLVETYHYVDAHERCTFHFDEYDLNTGERTRSRYAFISGGGFACYSGNEVSMLAQSAHVDPARGLSPDTLRLVFGKLQDQPVSKPVIDPDACKRALIADHCPATTESVTTNH
jgi:hypothetical protein